MVDHPSDVEARGWMSRSVQRARRTPTAAPLVLTCDHRGLALKGLPCHARVAVGTARQEDPRRTKSRLPRPLRSMLEVRTSTEATNRGTLDNASRFVRSRSGTRPDRPREDSDRRRELERVEPAASPISACAHPRCKATDAPSALCRLVRPSGCSGTSRPAGSLVGHDVHCGRLTGRDVVRGRSPGCCNDGPSN